MLAGDRWLGIGTDMTNQGPGAAHDTFMSAVHDARLSFEVSLREHTTMSQDSLDVVMASFDGSVADITAAVATKSVEIARETLG